MSAFASSTAILAALIPLAAMGGWITIGTILIPVMVSVDRFVIGSAVSVAAVVAYVATLQGTTPAKPKEPQGTEATATVNKRKNQATALAHSTMNHSCRQPRTHRMAKENTTSSTTSSTASTMVW